MSVEDRAMKLKDGQILYNDLRGKSEALVAPKFAQGTANDPGSFVVYTDGKVYYLENGHTAGTSWANTTKVETNIGAELTQVKSAIQEIMDDIPGAVSDWLDDHPEATTTVEDGSITKAKLDTTLQQEVDDIPFKSSNDLGLFGRCGNFNTSNMAVNSTLSKNMCNFGVFYAGKGTIVKVESTQSISIIGLAVHLFDKTGTFVKTLGNASSNTNPVTFDIDAYAVIYVKTSLTDASENITDVGKQVKIRVALPSGYDVFDKIPVLFTYGSIDSSGKDNGTSDTRLRTTDFLYVGAGSILFIPDWNNYFSIFDYDPITKVYKSTLVSSRRSVIYTFTNNACIRILLGRNDSASYTATDGVNIYIKAVQTNYPYNSFAERVDYSVATNISSTSMWRANAINATTGAYIAQSSTRCKCATNDYVPETVDFAGFNNVNNSRYRYEIFAWDSEGTFKGPMTQSGFVVGATTIKPYETIDFVELRKTYPGYKFKLTMYDLNHQDSITVNDDTVNAVWQSTISKRISDNTKLLSDSIVNLNKDREPFVQEMTAHRAASFSDTYNPLGFIHISDVHNNTTVWQRFVEYLNKYQSYLSFALHTGDYCGDNITEYTDLYTKADNQKPILNCVGNHDTYTSQQDRTAVSVETVYGKLFNHTSDWDVTFPEDVDYPTYYYKDISASNVRLIVLDDYYDLEDQATWLTSVLDDAKTNGLHVITASHEAVHTVTDHLDTTFQTIANFTPTTYSFAFDQIIADFKEAGGIHIAHLCGHEHHDVIGYTANGVLCVLVECALPWTGYTDSARVSGTRSYDCFNLFGVDANVGVFKMVRIGANADCFCREKISLCYDYINNELLYTN